MGFAEGLAVQVTDLVGPYHNGVRIGFCHGLGFKPRKPRAKLYRGFTGQRGFINLGAHTGIGEPETVQKLTAVAR